MTTVGLECMCCTFGNHTEACTCDGASCCHGWRHKRGGLRDQVAAAVEHGLAFEEADPDSVPIEIANSVFAAVEPLVEAMEQQRMEAVVDAQNETAKAEQDLAIAEQHIERGNIENGKAWREARIYKERAEQAEAQVARIRAFLEDMATWCSPHGVAADYSRRGLDALDGIERLGVDTPATQASGPTARELGESLAAAMAAMLPRAEPVFCHHENSRRSTHETMEAGWGRKVIVRLDCPACQAWVEQVNGEPVLEPKLLNVARCTEACAEQHTVRPGCLLAPDFSQPVLRSRP